MRSVLAHLDTKERRIIRQRGRNHCSNQAEEASKLHEAEMLQKSIDYIEGKRTENPFVEDAAKRKKERGFSVGQKQKGGGPDA